MAWPQALLDAAAIVAAAGAALAVDWGGARRDLAPPGFSLPWRRALATLVLASLLFLAVFGPLAAVGRTDPADLVGQPVPWLFAGHGAMLAAVAAWALLAFGGAAGGGLGERARRELGLGALRLREDLAAGVVGGAVAWLGMAVVVLGFGALAKALGGREIVPPETPEVIAWIGGLPVGVRIALSLSAGGIEELFFRGLLQPRIGAAVSTALFLLAHGSYEQPFMLVGLAWVSLVLAALARRQGSVWAAIVAHAVFDLVQLLVVIPLLLRSAGE